MRTVNRIVTPILAFLTFPVVIFLPLFRIMITSGFGAAETKNSLLSNFGLGEFISIKDLLVAYNSTKDNESNLFSMIWNAISGDKKQEIFAMHDGLHWGVIFLVALALIVILAFVLIIVAAATKKPSASVWLSIGGIVSALIMNSSFNAFAVPFVNGTVSLNSILGNTNQLLSVILGGLATVDYMKIGIVYTAVLLIFICTLILSICALVEQKNED